MSSNDGLAKVAVTSAVTAAIVSWVICTLFVVKKDPTTPTAGGAAGAATCTPTTTANKAWVLPIRPKPTAPYPDIRSAGGFLFLAGASNREPSTGTADSGYFVGVKEMANGAVEYDVEAQTHRVIQALRETLALAGHALTDLVKVNVYLVDPNDIPAFGKAYAKHFNADTGPIRTMVVVKRLPHKDIRVEIEGIALARHLL